MNQSTGRKIHTNFPFSTPVILNKGQGRMLISKEAFSTILPAKPRYSILSFIPESTIFYLPGSPVPTWNHSHQQVQTRKNEAETMTCLHLPRQALQTTNNSEPQLMEGRTQSLDNSLTFIVCLKHFISR